jgi:hypothetical protein
LNPPSHSFVHTRAEHALLFDVAVPVDTTAFKKAVMHHALAKEK